MQNNKIKSNQQVLCVERKMGTQLQDTRTVKKIIKIDEHVFAAFAGLTADARVLGKRARSECANFQFNYDDKVSTEYISRYVAQIQQRYTQSGGRRPFGVSFIMAGVDESGKHAIYMTDPSGYFARYKAISCGQNSKTVQEFFDKNYKDDMSTDETLRLAVSSLMDVVDQSMLFYFSLFVFYNCKGILKTNTTTGSRNIEVCQLKTTDNGCEARFVGEDELDELIKVCNCVSFSFRSPIAKVEHNPHTEGSCIMYDTKTTTTTKNQSIEKEKEEEEKKG